MSTSFPIKGEADKKIGAYAAPLSVTAQDVPNMSVKVRAGSFFNSQNVLISFAGGSTPWLAAPISTAKWVIVAITDVGTLVLVDGLSAVAPTLPTIPSGNLPLAAVYVPAATGAITNVMIADIRPFLRSTDIVPNLANELTNRPTVTDMNNALALKADAADTSLTGTPIAPTAAPGTNTTQIATTAFVQAVMGSEVEVSSFNTRTGAVTLTSGDVTTALTFTPANLVSPTFTGVPIAPTAAPGTNTTQIATTAFVQAVIGSEVEVSSFNTRTGAVTLTSGDVTTALTFTPYNATNPASYITSAGTATNFSGNLIGDVTGTQLATVVGKINGTSLAGLATGILKNTTSTGVPSIAVPADFPTLNQSTTGNAATVTNATFTTALTLNTGTLTLAANLANTSVLTIGAGAVSISGSSSGTNTGDNATNSSSLAVGATASDSSKLGGSLPAAYALVGQTTYVGTTAVAINRGSAALVLTGITSIDGSSASCTGTAATATAANALNTTTTPVVVNGAIAPTTGQVLTATSGIAATWQTPAASGVSSVSGTTNRVTSTGGATPAIDISATFEALLEKVANKDVSGGYAGLTLFKLNLRNAVNTITSWFTTAATVARTWTLPDKDGTVAMTSDITGTNSGTNTGDQTLPVKATGTELDSGTDDAKFATAKALADSTYVKPLVTSISTTGGTTTLTTAQNKSTSLEISGTLSSDAIIIVANTMSPFTVENLATGGFALTIKTAAGVGGTVSPGTVRMFYANGTDVDTLTTGREVLTAARTYYVATAGSNTNTGLTLGTPFLTIQKAIDVVASLDISIYNVTIQVADGTYTGGASVNSPWVGSGTVTLNGNNTTPSNVFINAAGQCITVQSQGRLNISNAKLQGTGYVTLYAVSGANISASNIVYGTSGGEIIRSESNAIITLSGSHTFTAGANIGIGTQGGQLYSNGASFIFAGSPTFNNPAFCASSYLGMIQSFSNTFTGTFVGTRYYASANSIIFTNGGGVNYFPGTIAGSVATGGQYL